MRCCCCNRNLSDYESTLRHPVTNDFLDICTRCLQEIPISPTEGINAENTDYWDEGEEQYVDELMDINDIDDSWDQE